MSNDYIKTNLKSMFKQKTFVKSVHWILISVKTTYFPVYAYLIGKSEKLYELAYAYVQIKKF